MGKYCKIKRNWFWGPWIRQAVVSFASINSAKEINYCWYKRNILVLQMSLKANFLFNHFTSSQPEVICKKKVFLKISQNSQENNCAWVSFLKKLELLKKKTLAQVFSCEFWKIYKNTFSYRASRVAASVISDHINHKNCRT